MGTHSVVPSSGRASLIALLAVLTMLAAACGEGEETAGTGAGEAAPTAEPTDDAAEPTEDDTEAGEPGSGEVAGEGCPRPEEMTEVTLGIRPSLVFADIYLAHHRGYFADENLDVSLEPVDAGTALQLVAGGEVDGVATGLTAGLFNAIHAGLDLFPVSPGGNDGPETHSQFWVRTELIESGEVTEMADLAGRRVAMPGTIGAGASQKMAMFLAQGGLALTDVQLENIAYPDMPGAFEGGSIDAAYVTAGASGPIEAADLARPFGDQQITVELNTNTIVFGPRLAEEQPEAGLAFLRAMIRAREDLQGQYWQDRELVDELAAATDIGEDVVAETARAHLPATLDFTPETWDDVQQTYIEAGVLDYDEVKPFDEVAATQVREDALRSVEACR